MFWLPLVLLLIGCSASQAGLTARHPRSAQRAPSPSAAGRSGSGDSIVSVSNIENSFGPYRALKGEQALLLWAAPGDNGPLWFSELTDVRGLPLAQPKPLKESPEEIDLVRVRATKSGFMALASSIDQDQYSVESLALGDNGELRGGQTLARATGDVVWIDVFGQAAHPVVAWAVQGSGGVDLFAVGLNDRGEPQSDPVRIFQGAIAWQGQALADGVVFALVVPSVAGQPQGTVQLVYVDDGAKVNATLNLSTSPTAQPDVDLIRIGDRLVCAWSDVAQVQAQIQVGVADTQGKLISAPAVAIPGIDEQALVRVVAAEHADHGYLLWEDLTADPAEPRKFALGRIDTSGKVSTARASVHYSGEGGTVPEIEAASSGVALLTQLSCSGCDDPAPYGYFARFANDLKLLSSSPVQVQTVPAQTVAAQAPQVQIADSSWGLDCAGNDCYALAALKESPARIFTVALSRDVGVVAGVAENPERQQPPLAVGARVVAETEPLAKVSAIETAQGTLVAWITEFDPNAPYDTPDKPAPDGRKEPVQAVLQLRTIARDGVLGPVQTISYRARSLGGVTVAHDPKSDQSLLVWSALDQKKPHLFATLVDAEGKKIAQRMLTSSAGEVYDSAAAFVGDGWVVSWVDARSGSPQAYTTKIDTKLARKSPDQPVSKDAISGVSLALFGSDLALLYSREDAATGGELIELVHVSGVNASLSGSPVRVSSGARHAHSPKLALAGSSLAAAWLEDESTALSAPSFLMWSSLAGGDIRPKQLAQDPAFGSVESATMACSESDCRLVAQAHGDAQHVVLLGGKIAAGASNSPGLLPLAELRDGGLPSTPALVGSSIFVADMSRTGRGWAKSLTVKW